MLFIVISLSLGGLYVLLQGFYLLYWHRYTKPATDYFDSPQPSLFISVIVIARNEEEHIGQCLDHLLHQHYPHDQYEIVVIDDHSTDNTRKNCGGVQ